MQTNTYGLIQGTIRTWSMEQTKHSKTYWVNTTPNPNHRVDYPQRKVHSKCQLLPSKVGPTVCWQFSRCMPQMLKLVCQENSACCPSKTVYKACKKDVAHKDCQLCVREANRHWMSNIEKAVYKDRYKLIL